MLSMPKFLQKYGNGISKAYFYASMGLSMLGTVSDAHGPVLQKKDIYFREVPVTVLVDKKFGKKYNPTRILSAASSVYSGELRSRIGSDVQFRAVKEIEWAPDYEAFVEDLMSDVKKLSGGGITLGFIDDPLFYREIDTGLVVSWVDEIGGNAAVVSSFLNVSDNEKRIRNRVVHSLGHIFGAHDTPFDGKSFMFDQHYVPTIERFDEGSRETIAQAVQRRHPKITKISVPSPRSQWR